MGVIALAYATGITAPATLPGGEGAESMAKKGKKSQYQDVFDFLNGWQNFLDQTFLRYTGKSVSQHIRDFAQQPKELPQGEGVMLEEPGMPLADAYAVLGLKPDAPLKDVKKHYRNLAFLFHSDRSGMNDEAMKLINRAYETITKRKV